ncbi:MAG: hypothetical protein QF886_23590, partial [Planctomycetota bacterium]|nr:hypothetical protein [Planctomycetota bacterium]
SGTQATDHYYGTKSSWYKLTWDLNDKRWYWLPENERETLKKDFRKQVRARLSKTRMQKILKPKSGYTELSQIMRAHSREFEIRAYEAFLKELDTLPWPDA